MMTRTGSWLKRCWAGALVVLMLVLAGLSWILVDIPGILGEGLRWG